VQWDDASLEILLAAWPEIHINRSSIFDITVELAEETQTDQEEIITSAPRPLKQESKKQARERHSWQRRKSTTGPGASQERLWD
jgi:prephenate dehydratase